jgi:hypothetical protein
VLVRWGFRVVTVTTNEMIRRDAVLYRVLRWLIRSRGKRAAASHPKIAEIRTRLLSDSGLFGDSLIVVAEKA